MKKIFFLIPIMFFFGVLSSYALDNRPSWYLIEKGKEAYEQRELGRALEFFREALSVYAPYPEAEMWIGKVFEQEGLFELALEQYGKALKVANSFYIPEKKYELLYTIAGLYEKKGNMKEMSDTLNQIVMDNPYYTDKRYLKMRDNILELILDSGEGLTKVVELYRLTLDFSFEAHKKLGYYHYQWNRRDRLIHFLLPVISIFSKSIEELKTIDPDYEYVSPAETLKDIMEYPVLERYTLDHELYQMLLLLGDSIAFEKRYAAAAQIWSLVVNYSQDEQLNALAKRRLANPDIKPPTVKLENP